MPTKVNMHMGESVRPTLHSNNPLHGHPFRQVGFHTFWHKIAVHCWAALSCSLASHLRQLRKPYRIHLTAHIRWDKRFPEAPCNAFDLRVPYRICATCCHCHTHIINKLKTFGLDADSSGNQFPTRDVHVCVCARVISADDGMQYSKPSITTYLQRTPLLCQTAVGRM